MISHLTWNRKAQGCCSEETFSKELQSCGRFSNKENIGMKHTRLLEGKN